MLGMEGGGGGRLKYGGVYNINDAELLPQLSLGRPHCPENRETALNGVRCLVSGNRPVVWEPWST